MVCTDSTQAASLIFGRPANLWRPLLETIVCEWKVGRNLRRKSIPPRPNTHTHTPKEAEKHTKRDRTTHQTKADKYIKQEAEKHKNQRPKNTKTEAEKHTRETSVRPPRGASVRSRAPHARATPIEDRPPQAASLRRRARPQ